jgi:dTDP-4-amino-4,6-dideoxygalactose transaminase
MLGKSQGIRLPELLPQTVPVLNQFPILFDDENTKEHLFNRINEAGIETTKLYPEPIHRVYNLYDLKKDPFPNATYFSRHLLLIPTHPIITIEKLSIITNIIKKCLEGYKDVPAHPP